VRGAGKRRDARAPLRTLRAAALTLCAPALAAVALGACGNTLQDQPIPHNELETLVAQPFPVYWLGDRFHGFQITEASLDPGGAATVQYGDCLEGGQSTCVTPVRVVTSPDNSFIPGGQAPHHTTLVRGVPAIVAEGGKAILFATGRVVVSIYAVRASLAAAASEAVVPINAPGSPGAALPARLPDSGFRRKPLPLQLLSPPVPLRGAGA
jgi:hypothetical protein